MSSSVNHNDCSARNRNWAGPVLTRPLFVCPTNVKWSMDWDVEEGGGGGGASKVLYHVFLAFSDASNTIVGPTRTMVQV